MALLQAGVPLEVIALYLGHSRPITTHAYVEADLKMKADCLRRITAPKMSDGKKLGASLHKDVTHKTANGGQACVACANSVAALLFEMIEKREDVFRGDMMPPKPSFNFAPTGLNLHFA